MIGSLVFSITYGIDILPDHDPLIAHAEHTIETASRVAVPGAVWVVYQSNVQQESAMLTLTVGFFTLVEIHSALVSGCSIPAHSACMECDVSADG